MLILLISTGFGIISNRVQYPWAIVGGTSLLFVLQSIVVLAMLHEKQIFAASVVGEKNLWLDSLIVSR
jgi:hypothetical protein